MHVLLYRSRSRPNLLAEDLNAIIDVAQRRNHEIGVTGLLLYGQLPAVPTAPGEFVQWIEGPEEAVEGLFSHIGHDERHFDVEILARGPVGEVSEGKLTGRLFPAWSMGLVRLAELPATKDGFLDFARTWDGDMLRQAA